MNSDYLPNLSLLVASQQAKLSFLHEDQAILLPVIEYERGLQQPTQDLELRLAASTAESASLVVLMCQ